MAIFVKDASQGDVVAMALFIIPAGAATLRNVPIENAGDLMRWADDGGAIKKLHDFVPPNVRGQWANINEAMSDAARAYQAQITGVTGQAFVLDGVKFDGMIGDVLLDAKGPGYASFVENGVFKDWFSGAEKLMKHSKDQVLVAAGVPIIWHVAEAEAAAAMRRLLADNDIIGISILHTPSVP